MLENAGDFVFNIILILSLFLPLGISFSIDSLKRSLLAYKELNPEQLNNREKGFNKSREVFSLAYFALLIQIASIYLFTGLNKNGYD